MAPQSTLISALTTKSGNAVLHVRATRIWESTNKEGNKLFSTKVVFVDEKESQIMLTVWNNQKQDYFPLLKEGSVYNISKFRVLPSQELYRAVRNDICLTFDHRTKVEPVEDTELIPCFRFELIEFDDIPPLLCGKKNFIEVVGMVTTFGETGLASNGATNLEVLIVNDRNQEMLVTLWEAKAAQFKQGLASAKGVAAFVVVTGLLAKQYSGKNIILSSSDATCTYFNIDYAPLNELKQKLLAITKEGSNPVLPPAKTQFVTRRENALTPINIQGLLETELADAKQVLRFMCEATIASVLKYDGWYYNSCPKCPKAIRVESNKFYCDACATETSGCKQRYKITVGVIDETGKTTFTIFNKDVQRLVGIPIESIIAEIGQAKLDEGVPPLMNNVVGKKCAFEVRVTSFNQDGRAGYGVGRLAEIGTLASNDEENAADQEAGPSKKPKITTA